MIIIDRHKDPDTTPAHSRRSVRRDDRGLSTPVTHSLAIGITTILIFGLVFAANGYLEDQRAAGARQQIEAIGTDLASQLDDIARLGDDSKQATLRVDQPGTVMSNTYSVSLEPPGECPLVSAANTCLVVDVSWGGEDLVRGFPVHNGSNVRVSIKRVDSGTFTLVATNTGGASTTSSVVAMEQTLHIGIGASVNQYATGTVLNPFNRPPIAKFTFNRSYPTSNEVIQFSATNSRDPDGDIVAYHWYVDTNNVSSGGLYNRTLSPGDHNVTLKVVDDEDGVATATRTVSVSGLEYNDGSLTTNESANQGKNVNFSLNNTWNKSITITHVLIDPEDNVTKIHYKENDDGDGRFRDAADAELRIDTDNSGDWDYGKEFNGDDSLDLSNKESGVIIPINPVTVDSGDTVLVEIRGFRGGGNPVKSTIGIRYWVNGESHRTIFTGGSK